MQLYKLTDNFYYSMFDEVTDKPILGYYMGKDFAIMLDAGNSKEHTKDFLDSVRALGLPYPKLVCITHSHWDHTFGLAGLDIPSFALKETYEKLKNMKKWKWTIKDMQDRVKSGEDSLFSYRNILKQFPDLSEIKVELPTNIIDEEYTIDLGDRTCEIRHVISAHDDDCAVFYLPKDHILFMGDAYSSVPVGDDWIYDKELLKEYIKMLKGYPKETICIKGHGLPLNIVDLIDELNGYAY